MKIVYLYPKSTFSRIYDSDFLFGITLTVLKYLKGDDYTNSLIRQFENNEPPFIFSNCFLFSYDEVDNGVKAECEKIAKEHFLPKPINFSKSDSFENIKEYGKLKEYKKQKYISLNKFEELINGNISSSDLFNEFITGKELTKPPTMRLSSNPHVQINRLTNASEEGHFYFTDDYSIENGGMFFLFTGDFEIVKPAFNFLNHFGLGSDTATGKGQFEFRYDDIEILEPIDANAFVNLSCYYPTQVELNYYKEHPNTLAYEIESKQGKIYSNNYSWNAYKKNTISYFAPGSVFPIIPEHNHYGCIKEAAKVDSTSIKFNGYSFKLKIKI